jgi:hypothetical protein
MADRRQFWCSIPTERISAGEYLGAPRTRRHGGILVRRWVPLVGEQRMPAPSGERIMSVGAWSEDRFPLLDLAVSRFALQ